MYSATEARGHHCGLTDDIFAQPARVPPDSPFDDARFREVLGHFGTGVTVITALDDDQPLGFTAQSFTSVSLDPPLISVCPSRRSLTWPRIDRSGAFCANVLAEGQEELARSFAVREADRFAGVHWMPSPSTGSPVLAGVLAWVECRVEAVHEAGDHLIVVGRVVGLGHGDEGRTPLLFYRGGYGRFAS